MKIGIFTECYKPTMNGVVVSIDTFKTELEKRGHEYYIFAPNTKKYEDVESRVYRLPSISVPGQGYYPVAIPFASPGIIDIVQKNKIDLIHCQHLFSMGGLGLSIGKKLNIPVVYTYHTLIAEYTHYVPLIQSLVKKYIIYRSRVFSNSCDQIVTPSNPMKRILMKYGVKTPIAVIPTGINIGNFKRVDSKIFRLKHNIPEDVKILLFVGRLAEEKNISFLLKAFKKVIEKTPAHLVLIGGGSDVPRYKKEARNLGINRSVTFTGYLSKPETDKIFGMADIFAFASITETQGIVIAEAMAAGAIPVAVNKMGPTDVINSGENGLLTDLTLSDFSSKISYLIKNPALLKNMSLEAQKTATLFSSQATADKMEKLYTQVLEKGARVREKNILHSRSHSLSEV